MKKNTIGLLLFLVAIFSCSTKSNEVLIRGKVVGEIPSKLLFTKPVEGITSWAFLSESDLDSLGNFEIKLESDKALILGIKIPKEMAKSFIVEPGQQYQIQIDLGPEKPEISMDGPGKVGFDAFVNLPSMRSSQYTASMLYREKETESEMFQEIERLKGESLSVFDSLYAAEFISEEFFDLVKLEMDCFYKAVRSDVYYQKFRKTFEGGEFSEEDKRAWRAVFSDVSWENLSRSTAFYEMLESYLRSQVFTNEEFDRDEVKAKYDNGQYHTYQLGEAEKYIEAPFLHYFKAYYLYLSALQKRFEKELISLYGEFKQDYPQSMYTKDLEPMIEPIVLYHEKIGEPFGENVKFVADPKKTNTLKDAAKGLKGKMVYVDVWATWCGPCKAEFEHKEQLEEVLKKYDIASLYISIDRPEYEQKWNEMIKYYGLNGHHIRANKELDAELREVFDNEGSLSIPWYLLLDEEGNIVEKHFVRPSNMEELEKKLNEINS